MAAKKTATKGTKSKTTATKTTKTTKTTKKTAKPVGPKGPGVIASLVEYLSKATAKAPTTKQRMLDQLVKRFPDRGADAMKKTINCQIPSRLSKEKGVTVHSDGEGGFWMK